MKLILILLLFFNFLSGCDDRQATDLVSEMSEEKREIKIKNLLIGCQVKISSLDSTFLYDEDQITLDKQLSAFSGSTNLFARKRGVLLDNSRVITSLSVRDISRSEVFGANKVYMALFDGKAKKLLSSVFIGGNISVISILQDSSKEYLIGVDAIVRQGEQPAKEVRHFDIEVKNNTITLL